MSLRYFFNIRIIWKETVGERNNWKNELRIQFHEDISYLYKNNINQLQKLISFWILTWHKGRTFLFKSWSKFIFKKNKLMERTSTRRESAPMLQRIQKNKYHQRSKVSELSKVGKKSSNTKRKCDLKRKCSNS